MEVCVVALEPTRTDGCFSAPEVEIIAPKITPKHWLALTGLLLRAQKIQSFRRIVIFRQAMSISLMRIVAILMQNVLKKVFPNAMLHHQHCLYSFRDDNLDWVQTVVIIDSTTI